MDSRLKEIKKRNEDCRLEVKDVASQEDLDWLISEFGACRAEVESLNRILASQGIAR